MPLSSESKRKQRTIHRIPITLSPRELMAEKHILRIEDIIGKIDPQKTLYPNGLVTELEEDETSDQRTVKRIELFAKNERSNDTYGVMRSFFLGFSWGRDLLSMANISDNVVSVRAVPWSGDRSESKIIEDKLVLKRLVSPDDGSSKSYLTASSVFRRHKIPSLIVSPRWLDRMDLCSGDRIIVSNPVENYMTPPPEAAGAN